MNRDNLSRALFRISAALPGGRQREHLAHNGIDIQPPLRAELFSTDQMEQHGKALAGAHALSSSRPQNRLLRRLDENELVLLETFCRAM